MKTVLLAVLVAIAAAGCANSKPNAGPFCEEDLNCGGPRAPK
jgi:hypothetical protein